MTANLFKAMIATIVVWCETAQASLLNFASPMGRDDRAVVNLGQMLALIGTVLTVIVTFLVLAALFGDFAGAVNDVNTNLTNTSISFGDATTDSIKPVFAIVIGLAALVGIVGLILRPFGE